MVIGIPHQRRDRRLLFALVVLLTLLGSACSRGEGNEAETSATSDLAGVPAATAAPGSGPEGSWTTGSLPPAESTSTTVASGQALPSPPPPAAPAPAPPAPSPSTPADGAGGEMDDEPGMSLTAPTSLNPAYAAYCSVVRDAAGQLDAASGADPSGDQRLEQVKTAFARVTDAAPAEIKADLVVVNGFIQAHSDASDTVTEPPDVAAAHERVDDWFGTNCGTSLG